MYSPKKAKTKPRLPQNRTSSKIDVFIQTSKAAKKSGGRLDRGLKSSAPKNQDINEPGGPEDTLANDTSRIDATPNRPLKIVP